MSFTIFRGKQRIANLVFTDYVVRYVELKQVDPPMIQSYGEYYLPPGVITDGRIIEYDTLTMILEQCIAEWKISKKQVRFLVPNPSVVIRKTLIPEDIQVDEIEGYLYLELGTSIHLPFEDPVFDIVMLNEGENGKDILLFAAPEERIVEYTDLLENCKLRPIAADISSLALYRLAYLSNQSDKNEHCLVLDFDVLHVTATIFHDDKPVFMRFIPLPGDLYEWEKERVSSTEESTLVYIGDKDNYFLMLEDMITEIERVLSFYKYSFTNEQNEITKVLVSGDHPLFSDIYQVLDERLEIPVSMLEQEVITTAKQEKLPRRYDLALGLAIKGVK